MIPPLAHVVQAVTLVAALSPATRQSTPDMPAHLRQTIERHVLVVRVLDEGGEIVGTGTGILMAEQNSLLRVLTARHVVLDRESGERLGRVQVQIHGVWKDVGPTIVDLGRELDAAVVSISIHTAGPVSTGLFRDLRAAPLEVVERNATIWVLGWDEGDGGLTWRGGRVLERREGLVVCEAEGVRPGYSGGGVFTRGGEYVGLVSRTGSGLVDFKAIPFDRIFAAAAERELAVGIEQEAAAEALAHALGEDLLIGLCHVRHDNQLRYDWAVIRLDSEQDGVFRGSLLGRDCKAKCRLRLDDEGGLVMSFEPGGGAGGAFSKLAEFQLSGELSLPSFVVLSAKTGQDSGHLAIPTGTAELLGARLLASGADIGAGSRGITPSVASLVRLSKHREVLSVHSEPPTFPVRVPTLGQPNQIPTVILPDRLRIRGGRLHGDLVVTDGYEPDKDKKQTLARALVTFRVEAGGAEVQSATFALDPEARRTPIELPIPAGSETLTWSMAVAVQGKGMVLLENIVVETAD